MPGTGAYYFASYDPNKALVMKRNPYFKEWSHDAQPDGYPDEIIQSYGLTVEAQITAVENGQADWSTRTRRPTARRARHEVREPGARHPVDRVLVLPMNVNLPPFNNLKARLAVNYAIDRNAAVKIFGGPNLATPSCQVLPPGFPGHKAYCPYTKNPGTKWSAPDIAKAKQLVKESGSRARRSRSYIVGRRGEQGDGRLPPERAQRDRLQGDVKPISGNIFFTYVQNTKNKVQINVQQWYQDYPAASDFLYVLFGCESFHPGSDSSINFSGSATSRSTP